MGPREILDKVYALRIPFIENRGQIPNESLKYYAKTFGGSVFITGDGQIAYSLPHLSASTSEAKNVRPEGWVIRERFVGGSALEVFAEDEAVTKVNYFKGKDSAHWKRDIPTYRSVKFGDIYAGIGLKMKAYGNNIEKIFSVGPGADPADIKVQIEGAEYLEVNQKGELEIQTGLGIVKFTKPVAYQEKGTDKEPVDVTYLAHGRNTYGFEVGSHDKSRTLFIDPILASTFLGGGNGERGNAIAVGDGYVAVAGWARSGFPTTPGAYDEDFNGGDYDSFVSILDSDLTTLNFSTFIGGDGQDTCHAIVIGNDDNITIAGYTASTNYPTTAGAYDESHNGGEDVFISKFNPSLSELLASTFIGGSYSEYCHSISLDGYGNVYVTGYTYSTNYPTTPGAYDETDNPAVDTFISKFNSDLTILSASTYLGGSDGDFGNTIRIYGTDTVFIAGDTRSSDFPTTPGSYDESFNGNDDLFVASFDSSLSTLAASTLIGGSDFDRLQLGSSFVLDGNGNVFVTGETYSSNYPTTSGAYDETFNGGSYDAFVSKLNNSLSSLLASTFLGGNGSDSGNAIALDGSGNVYLTGTTDSSNFTASSGAYDATYNGGWDNFISKFNDSLSTLSASTFLGGEDDDGWSAIALDEIGNVYVTGYTYSSDFPSTSGAYDESFNGSFDVFISKLDENLSGPFLPVPDIKANGSDGPITISKGHVLSITVELDSGDHKGDNADWWALCKTPFPAPNDWYHYDLSSQSWKKGQIVTRQGALIDFPPQEILNQTNLRIGTYIFYFGVDMIMNGSINPAVLHYDLVQVTINP